ncbi:DUF2207 family protein [uncultured Friedmanniella sp.]|uniref:DUF2207 family protein n=1 Tax=uncultured Friedmanniella sp. TaxID=335381 RepID=UPI0035C99586
MRSLPHARPPRRRLAALLLGGTAAVGLVVGPLALPAAAAGTASTVTASGNLGKDGVLKVQEKVTYSGAAPAQLTQRFETRQDLVGGRQYVQTLSPFTATVGGAAVTPTVSTDKRFTEVTVPTNGATEVVLSYSVTGATVNLESGETALRWAMLQGLDASVQTFSATVQIPGSISYVRCTAGAPNSAVPCRSAAASSENAQTPVFNDGPRGPGEVVVVDIGFPAGTVAATEVIDHQWSFGRAFSPSPLPLALALGLLVLGGIGLVLAHRRRGRDVGAGGQVARVAEFAPTAAGHSEFRVVDDVRPGHVGTVADERVDPIDITATLVDLAVRGHLRITELSRASAFARADWDLTRLSGGDALRPFEQALLDGIAPEGGNVLVSELSSRVHGSIVRVQDLLYDEMVQLGWYEHRPDATRNRWTRLAVVGLMVAVVVTVLLAAFTTLGLIGLALIVLALGLVFVAQEMPSRTAKGTALLTGLGALRSDLLSHPTDQMPTGRELEELSQLLPYAIVLGGSERWLDAIVASDADADADSTDLSWYHGPENWHLRDLPDSLRNFITGVSGTLFSR